jgi:membrane protein DedA with SNARE-associated domain
MPRLRVSSACGNQGGGEERMFADFARSIADMVRDHAVWAPFVVGILAFCESLAVVSFFVPATIILVAVGGLIGTGDLVFWEVWLGAVVGAVLGDWLSYVVGHYFKAPLLRSRFFADHRDAADKAMAFMRRWGGWGVFLGRFSGPLRAFVPLAAGLLGIPQVWFQAANIGSALVWATALLSPGTLLGQWLG